MATLDFKVHEQVPVTEDKAESAGRSHKNLRASLRHRIREAYARHALPPKAPDATWIGSLGGQRLRVHEPFHVAFRSEELQIVAEATEIDEFGFGATQSEALADLQRAITEALLLTLWR
jgi:hypothetical protein